MIQQQEQLFINPDRRAVAIITGTGSIEAITVYINLSLSLINFFFPTYLSPRFHTHLFSSTAFKEFRSPLARPPPESPPLPSIFPRRHRPWRVLPLHPYQSDIMAPSMLDDFIPKAQQDLLDDLQDQPYDEPRGRHCGVVGPTNRSRMQQQASIEGGTT